MNKTERVSLRISEDLFKKIKRLADKQKRSINNMSEILLTTATDQQLKKESTMRK